MIYWTAADNWGTTNSQKHNYRREKHNYWFLQFLTEIYQLSGANCVEYPWELIFTGHYTRRNFRQNQNNLSALILKAFILPDGSAWLVTYFCIKQDQKRFLNQNRHEQILVLIFSSLRISPSSTVVCTKMTKVRGFQPTGMLTFVCVFMMQCWIIGPVQNTFFVYLNMLHCHDKCSLIRSISSTDTVHVYLQCTNLICSGLMTNVN